MATAHAQVLTLKDEDFALAQDEIELLHAYRKAKKMYYSDVEMTIQEGRRVKLWVTEKMR